MIELNPGERPQRLQDPAQEKLAESRAQLKANTIRLKKLQRELDSLHSLADVLERVKDSLQGYADHETIKIVPENELVSRTIRNLFPVESRVTTKHAACRRIGQYFDTLALKSARLQEQLSRTARYQHVLEETCAVSHQLIKLRQEKQAAKDRLARERAAHLEKRAEPASPPPEVEHKKPVSRVKNTGESQRSAVSRTKSRPKTKKR